jgi:endonuclease-3
MREKERIDEILRRIEERYPRAKTELRQTSPLEMLVATILSAQCTDERVNMVTRSLFSKYRTAEDYAKAPREELEADIKTTGFYRNKAKSIQGAASKIIKDFGGRVPSTMEDLLTLPGVARKTANVVLSNSFGIAAGITVDTHVIRVSQRLGLTKNTEPEKIERDLMKIIPQEKWIAFSHQIILLGRYICKARKPLHDECPLADICPSASI